MLTSQHVHKQVMKTSAMPSRYRLMALCFYSNGDQNDQNVPNQDLLSRPPEGGAEEPDWISVSCCAYGLAL